MIKYLILVSSLVYISHSFKTPQVNTYLLTEALKQNASCLDGTPPIYSHILGQDDGINKWYIHFEGGAWCTSLENCYNRSLTYLGSSANITQIFYSHDYFSEDKDLNPLMYNWNKIIVHYCDGGSFSGDATAFFEGNLLHFRGKNNLNAIFDDLINLRGMNASSDVVISGSSAGALSSILHGDHIREKLFFVEKVVILPDSGFFLDYQGNNVNYHKDMQWVFYSMNSRGGVNKECIDFYPLYEEWRCIFAEYTIPFVKTPIFMLQSKYDQWQVDNVLGDESVDEVNNFGADTFNRLVKTLLASKKNSGFIDSCYHHCGGWNTIHIDGSTQADVFNRWYNMLEPKPFIQEGVYKCDECCN